MTSRPRWFDPLGAPGPQRRAQHTPPPPISEGLRALAARRGWRSHLVAGDLAEIWDSVVGPQVAAHTRPLRLQGGVLVLTAGTAMWASEVRQLGAEIITRVNERLGPGTVRTITVSVRRPKPR